MQLRQMRTSRVVVPVLVAVALQEIYHVSRLYYGRLETGRRKQSDAKHIPALDTESKQDETRPGGYDFLISPMARDFSVTKVDCNKIINGHPGEIDRGRNVTLDQLPEAEVDLSIYMELRHSCASFKRRRGYILHHLTDEERDFPIAVSLLLFKDFHQVEKLLRTMYRPQNYYCLHIDLTADPQSQAVVRAYADCFDNVITSRDVIDIRWGSFSLTEGEFVCMFELLKRKGWKYFINLTGQEFPLKTNRQMVKILNEFNGGNDLWTSPIYAQRDRFRRRFGGEIPPHNLRLIKGSSHITFSRAFVEFITGDSRVRDLASFVDKTGLPEESFWTSINNDVTLHGPGGFNGTLLESIRKPWSGRVKWWRAMKMRCSSRYKRNICIFGVADIHRLVRATPILANKFYWDHQPIALACLQEWMFNRTRDEYLGRYTFDVSRYENLPNARKMFIAPTNHSVWRV